MRGAEEKQGMILMGAISNTEHSETPREATHSVGYLAAAHFSLGDSKFTFYVNKSLGAGFRKKRSAAYLSTLTINLSDSPVLALLSKLKNRVI